MSDTGRGLMVFVGVLASIGLWVPLSSHAERGPAGWVITENYFGLFRYLTLRTELKEPNYLMVPSVDPFNLVVTLLVTASMWALIVWKLRATRPARSAPSLK